MFGGVNILKNIFIFVYQIIFIHNRNNVCCAICVVSGKLVRDLPFPSSLYKGGRDEEHLKDRQWNLWKLERKNMG